MANRGQSQYLRIFNGATTIERWQNYYVNQTVTLSSASWSYFPFSASGLASGAPGTADDVTIELPATSAAVALFESAINNSYLCELKAYEFDSRLTQSAPQASQLLIVNYVGEVIGISGSFTSLAIKLGSSLAPVGAQVPPRKFTSRLIGAPIRI